MGRQTVSAVLVPRTWTVVLGLLIACGIGCDGTSSSNTSDNGAAGNGSTAVGPGEGEACQITDPYLSCTTNATLCYAAGTDSPCSGDILCIGDGTGMACAHRCTEDADCRVTSTTAVCMQGCKAPIVNGYCVEPSARTDLLETTCTTWSIGSTGTSGVSM